MEDIKPFNLRIERDLWVFLKKHSVDQNKSMTEIIGKIIRRYKNKCEKKLTLSDTKV
jgi:hypothetical protein